LSLTVSGTLNERVGILYKDSLQQYDRVQGIQKSLMKSDIIINRVLNSTNVNYTPQDGQRDLDDLVQEDLKRIDSYKKAMKSEENKLLFQKFQDALNIFVVPETNIMKLLQEGNKEEAVKLLNNDFKVASDNAIAAVD